MENTNVLSGPSGSRNEALWMWLCSIPEIGPRSCRKLLDHFENDIERIYRADRQDLEKVLTPALAGRLEAGRNDGLISRDYEAMLKKGIRCVSCLDPLYPDRLMDLDDPPAALFVKGRLPSGNELSLAFVGSRNCSSYGLEITRMFSRSIACEGISVVSGMARGIDSAAHSGCLEAGGRTYAVLGCGADVCYPRENINLYESIPETGGIISEFPPGTSPLAQNFPRRNRLIAALAGGIIITEARMKSGSLITAELGLDLGREIFAVPGRITDPISEGCNKLLRDGAHVVTCANDILLQFGINRQMTLPAGKNGTGPVWEVYRRLSLIAKSSDEISHETGLPVSKVLESLIRLEIEGMADRIGKAQYIVKL
ncbi:MAG: DNA-processing protein DprA [Lachnospiraceae bacterium]|nr:DNA-processing protein DprA [Lachnospiraceae bacterium]